MSSKDLYSAVYSGVPVYEFINPKSSVMRRKKDGWINATHILKVADFPKAKRTRILERDVQIGVHEKVQGGYGKYQGTWVPMERAIEIAVEFGVRNELDPLFDYRSTGGASSPPPAPKHHHASGAAKKAKAAAAAALAASDSTGATKARRSSTLPALAGNGNGASSSLSPAPTKSVAVKRSATTDSLTNGTTRKRTLKAPKPQLPTNSQFTSRLSRPSTIHHSQSINLTDSDSDFDDSDSLSADIKQDLQAAPTTTTQTNNGDNNNDSSSPSEFLSDADLDNALQETQPYTSQLGNTSSDLKRQQLQQQSQLHHQQQQNYSQANQDRIEGQHSHNSTQENQSQTNESQQPLDNQHQRQQQQSHQDQQNQEWFENTKKTHTQKLLEYFLSTEDNLNNSISIPGFITDPYSDFDVNQVIDRDGNTTFHWACAMGDLRMCDSLLTRGCNYRALNNEGQVPIMRSVLYTNSYSRRTFAKLLDLLRDSLLDSDSRGRTILHHIGFSTGSNNNLPSARYYTEILLTKIAETVQPMERIINFINQQDHDGNTALHIMVHNGAKKCIRVLLGYNARVDIPNNRNEFVSDYLYNNNFFDSIGAGVSQLSQGQQQLFEPQHLNDYYTGKTPISTHQQDVDSFNHIRPFNPSLNYHNPSIGQQFSILNGSNYLTVPHYSEAAMQVNQKSSEILERLGELSNAFDVELQQRDSDIKELNNILTQMDSDIKKTENDINEIMDTVLKEKSMNEDTPLKEDNAKMVKKVEEVEVKEDKEHSKHNDNDISFGKNLELIKSELRKAESQYLENTQHLKKLIERSQAKDLATVVQQSETDKFKELNIVNESDLKPSIYNAESLQLVLDLITLQITRKETVNELVSLYADASDNTEVIASYRRLVSGLSNVPINEVDESLNDIEECLKNDDL